MVHKLVGGVVARFAAFHCTCLQAGYTRKYGVNELLVAGNAIGILGSCRRVSLFSGVRFPARSLGVARNR